MFVYGDLKVKRYAQISATEGREFRLVSGAMPKREPTTRELKIAQDERATDEHEAIEGSLMPDEAQQHKRRASKAAYLKRKLAERERSERES